MRGVWSVTIPGVYSVLQHDAFHCQLLRQITCSSKYQHIHVQTDRAVLHATMQCSKGSKQGTSRVRMTAWLDRSVLLPDSF